MMEPIDQNDRRKAVPNRTHGLQRDVPLTSQRAEMIEALDGYLSQLVEGEHSGLIVIDIRDFRLLNRSFGSELADNILLMISARLNGLDTTQFQYFYLGNDEFAIVLPRLARTGLALLHTEQVLLLFKDMFVIDEHTLKITVNAGVAINIDPATDPTAIAITDPNSSITTARSLLYDAEDALHLAKQTNRPFQLLGESQQKSGDRLQWQLLNELHSAMRDDEMSLYYQPKIPLSNKAKSAAGESNHYAEALIRWETETHGLITPNVTLPLIEHLGSERDLIRWLLNTALKQLSEADSQSTHRNHVSINIPAVTVTTQHLYADLEQALSIWDIDPARLTLEITEDVLIEDKETAFDYLSKIRETGVKIAIDDFGTGYSSLAYFRHIPADEIKIDRTFIQGMRDNDSDRNLVKWIIELSHAFQLQVVAEGVEDEQTLNMLCEMGCDFAQGFLISRPLPYSDYIEWLGSDSAE